MVKAVVKPLAVFFEENLSYYLLEINKFPVLRCLLQAIVELGCVEEHQDLIDEMLRQVQKKESYEKDSEEKGILLGH